MWLNIIMFYPFRPEFTIVISIHYKPRIAEEFSICSGRRWLEVDDKWEKNTVIINNVP